eukprot:COSAG01_NODE_5892_length_3966_cov_2.409514_5_plen_83_part_00
MLGGRSLAPAHPHPQEDAPAPKVRRLTRTPVADGGRGALQLLSSQPGASAAGVLALLGVPCREVCLFSVPAARAAAAGAPRS